MNADRAAIGRSKQARTRGMLVEAAMRVIAKLGPDAPQVHDFASEAEVARGTFYNYFETTEDVLIAVAIAAAEAMEAELSEIQQLPDPADVVACAVRSYIRRAAKDPVWGWTVVRIALLAAPLGSAMRANLSNAVAAGSNNGRFRVPSAQVAYDLVLGAGLMGMRSVLRGDAAPEHAEDVAGALLAGLGVRDAVRVARRDLSSDGIRRRISRAASRSATTGDVATSPSVLEMTVVSNDLPAQTPS